jgi:hypothetical protein
LLTLRTEVSCFSVTLFYSTLFCCGGKVNLVWFALFYSTLLALSHRQTDGLTENEYTCFAWAGGTCPRFVWAGGTFSPVVQFLVLAGNRCWFYILLMYLGCRTIQLWCCVSFFGIFLLWRESGSGGKLTVFLLWRESFITTGKKSYSRLSGGLCCCVSFWFWRLRPEKKSYSHLSGGLCCCVSFWFWREIGSSFCCGGKVLLRPEKKVPVVWRLRPEKRKVLVVCMAGCAVVSVFGSGGKLAVFLLWRESFITTGTKKVPVVWRFKFVLVQLELKLIQIH